MTDTASMLPALEEALKQSGEIALPAYGFSMKPPLSKADALVIKSAAVCRPRWGSIIVFKRFDRWVAHRVIFRAGRTWITKGDAVKAVDYPFVRDCEIVGVVGAYLMGNVTVDLANGRARIGAWARACAGLLVGAAWAGVQWVRRVFRSGR